MVRQDGQRRGDQMNQLAGYLGNLESIDAWGLIDLMIEMGAVNHDEAWWLMSHRMVQEVSE